ncbi:hypothetical protein [Paracoccus saliphilus]|uniref:Uncharacterized protein n=1 Tax=Paracoccus saliphilus TaxID=405559 RepID=A0AA45W0S2_9RHOB|nr:hypothetical protein [Paracoccus saliphilus]SIS51150.1 hypothetical protein SAMN05421772_101173 [Paracoccus saliphilus]
MKAVLTGLIVMIAVSLGAWLVLGETGFSSQEVYSSPNVRLD